MYETYAYRPSLYYNIKGTLTRRISAIFLLLPKDALDVRVRSDELDDERASQRIFDRLAVAKKLIPLFPLEEFALTLRHGQKGLTPEYKI